MKIKSAGNILLIKTKRLSKGLKKVFFSIIYPHENPHLEFIILSILVIITDKTIRKETLKQQIPTIILNGVNILRI